MHTELESKNCGTHGRLLLTKDVVTDRDSLVVAFARLLRACGLLSLVRLLGGACGPVRWNAASTLGALRSSRIVLLIAVHRLPRVRARRVLAGRLGTTSSAPVMLLSLVLLGTLRTCCGRSAVRACASLLSRLIMAMLVGVPILIQTVVILLALFRVSTFLGGRAVLGAPEVACCRWRVGFVL